MIKKSLCGFFALIVCAVLFPDTVKPLRAAEPAIDNGAVAVMYHRFGDDRYPSTNIRLEQFEAHLRELQSGRYHILPLPEIVAALRDKRILPDRTVALTIDDAFLSVYEEAWPRLKEAGLPFTLFVSTAPVDQAVPGYMSWSQLRELASSPLVTIGHHAHEHSHLAALDEAAQRKAIDDANTVFRRALGRMPELFAYPYGEMSQQLRKVVQEAGLIAAFGQHSGAIGRTADHYLLPRYPLNERFGELDRFKLAVNSLPLPVLGELPLDPLLGDGDNPPHLGFNIHPDIPAREDGTYRGLNCYSSQNEISLQQLGGGRIEVRLSAPFKPGRARINCTMPGPEGRWRWLGRQYYVPE